MATETAEKVPNGEASIPDSIPAAEPEPDNTSKLKTFLGILRRFVTLLF
jgi:hypothetical protein